MKTLKMKNVKHSELKVYVKNAQAPVKDSKVVKVVSINQKSFMSEDELYDTIYSLSKD
jgi:hypothetical protein